MNSLIQNISLFSTQVSYIRGHLLVNYTEKSDVFIPVYIKVHQRVDLPTQYHIMQYTREYRE